MNDKWVLGADIVSPAKPARRLSAHVPSPHENTGCPQKKDLLLWRAVAPINIDLGSKVGGVLESEGSQL